MQVCTLLQTDNHASTPPLSFLQAGCPSCRPTNSVKALKAQKGHQAYKKLEWWGAGMVICLARDADLRMAQLMPLPLSGCYFSKIQIGFTFLVLLTWVVLENGCVCVCYKLPISKALMYAPVNEHHIVLPYYPPHSDNPVMTSFRIWAYCTHG